MMDVIDEKQRKMVESSVEYAKSRDAYHPHPDKLQELIAALDGNELMAQLLWVYWGRGALRYIDGEIPVLNRHLRWWKFKQEKRTIRKLIQTPEGKAEVWQMLNDYGAWF